MNRNELNITYKALDLLDEKFQTNPKLTEQFIKENADFIDWKIVTRSVNFSSLSISFIKKYKEDWDWWYISKNVVLPRNFFYEFKNHLHEDYAFIYHN